MNPVNHHNELVELSQSIYNQAANKITNYCANKYCGVGNDTTEQQLLDYLFVAEETSAYFLGNALALLTPTSQEKEIMRFTDKLRAVIVHVSTQLNQKTN
ncbi:hypothetical protein [Aristaeella lactis]|uniref:Uncharacterized protein n=1 Tax=Aristaeella lactis TaxID=3046383 RepID=A0AC61PLK3_9FIRM|nr:hypothetical protein [Aristaeella lactis]QUA54653.1 hypothetical protein JYE50_15480 [Aristaeella lactis]SMC63883.1 hypothetical protein SAMN06297397_1704 [Aristaeella lactis]